MKHILYLLQSDIKCGSQSSVKKVFKDKLSELFKLSKQYIVIKSLEKDVSECYIEEIVDLI